jgi:DNA-binding MarR family transcriptional regulator
VNKYYNTYLNRTLGLSVPQIAILTVLYENGGIMNPSAIADITYTERHNITVIVDRMKKAGLVRTERDSKDKRLVNIILTDKGREVYIQSAPVVNKCVQQIAAVLSDDNAILIQRPLRILRQNAKDLLTDLNMSKT